MANIIADDFHFSLNYIGCCGHIFDHRSQESEMKRNADFWADHDERCHYILEDLRDGHHEGLRGICCKHLGDRLGCKKSCIERDSFALSAASTLNRTAPSFDCEDDRT